MIPDHGLLLQEELFVIGFNACFQNARIIRVYFVASGIGMLFSRVADNLSRSRLLFSLPAPRLPTSFTLSSVGN